MPSCVSYISSYGLSTFSLVEFNYFISMKLPRCVRTEPQIIRVVTRADMKGYG